MVPDPPKTCLGLEYFCFEGDGLWTMPDAELIALGTREVGQIGLLGGAKGDRRHGGPHAEGVSGLRRGLRGSARRRPQVPGAFTNLQVAGRNGMHKYNNQDHSMVTAMLAVDNLAGQHHDTWSVNQDDEYHEEGNQDEADVAADLEALEAAQPRVPQSVR